MEKKIKLKKIHVDLLRAISLYQKENNGEGMPGDDYDLMMKYIKRAHELDYWG